MTNEFIKANPTSLVLTRHTESPSATGGVDHVETNLLAQDFVISGGASMRPPEATTEAGNIANYTIQLIGYYDADVQDGDTFTIDGGRYQVDFVYPDRDYRTVVQAIYRGRP